MSRKLPTVMRWAQPPVNDRDYARPPAYVNWDGAVYVELARGTVRIGDEYGEHRVDPQLRPSPATAAELLTRHEAAAELAELLERIAMSKTARTAVDRVINTYGGKS